MNFQKWELFSGSLGMLQTRALVFCLAYSRLPLQLTFLVFLNYGISAWGMTYESLLNPQKKILRCIKFEPFLSPNTPIFQSLKTLKIVDVLHLNILTFVYKSIDKLSPSCFHDYFQPNSSVHRIGTRQATRGDLFKSFKNTTLFGPLTKIQSPEAD